MKTFIRKNYLIPLLIMLFLPTLALGGEDLMEEENIIDLGKCGFKIREITSADRIDTDFASIRTEKRDSRLQVVKLSGKTPSKGIIIYNQTVLSMVYELDGEAKIAASKGVGQKFTDSSGKNIELWALSAENGSTSIKMELEEGETVVLYAAFELPMRACNFKIQVPTILH